MVTFHLPLFRTPLYRQLLPEKTPKSFYHIFHQPVWHHLAFCHKNSAKDEKFCLYRVS